jgi:thiol-disulfide isomerase/thioredoxin
MKKIWANISLKIVFILATVLVGTGATTLLNSKRALAQEINTNLETTVTLHFFWAEGCPHCAKEHEFLKNLQQELPYLEIKEYELSKSRENQKTIALVGKVLGADVSGVPFTVVGNKHIAGYLDDDTTGAAIKNFVEQTQTENCVDIVGMITNNSGDTPTPNKQVNLNSEDIPNKIDLLFWKNIELKTLSLPAITFVLALADGFNPCAMWVLLFLISFLLGMKDRKKMWILGGTFILASGFVYFLFLAAWLNFFLFIGMLKWVRIVIGLVALVSGSLYIKDYLDKKSGCKVVGGNEKRKQTFEQIKKYVMEEKLIVAIGGIALLAFAVNIVEFFCSAGLPAIYTKILSINNLPGWKYYMYLLGYIVIFMIDDMIVFFVAMTTLETVGIESKYARTAHVIGGVLMVLIGLAMLFKPELLMMG